MSLVLADTSVWIDFLCGAKSHESGVLSELLEQDRVCIAAIIRAEILSGARDSKQFDMLKDRVSALPLLGEPPEFWDSVAFYRFTLARKGVQVSLTDLAIAYLAHFHHCPLLTRDKEFKHIAQALPLKFA